jgi:hypothetical protein
MGRQRRRRTAELSRPPGAPLLENGSIGHLDDGGFAYNGAHDVQAVEFASEFDKGQNSSLEI